MSEPTDTTRKSIEELIEEYKADILQTLQRRDEFNAVFFLVDILLNHLAAEKYDGGAIYQFIFNELDSRNAELLEYGEDDDDGDDGEKE